MPDPVILELGSLQLRWYGVFAATAMLVSYFMLTLRARKSTFLKQDDVPSLLALCIVAGLIGARAEYVRRFWTEYFSHDPAAIFRVWQGGLVFQGGFILGFLAALVYCRVRKWPCGALGDLVAPSGSCPRINWVLKTSLHPSGYWTPPKWLQGRPKQHPLKRHPRRATPCPTASTGATRSPSAPQGHLRTRQ